MNEGKVPRAKSIVQESKKGVGNEVAAGHADEWSSGGPLEWGKGGGEVVPVTLMVPTHAVMTHKQARTWEPS